MKKLENNKNMIGYKLRGGGKVLRFIGYKDKQKLYECECQCGTLFTCIKPRIIGYNIFKPRYGCRECSFKNTSKLNSNSSNMIGKKFNRLIVLSTFKQDSRGRWHYKCKCDCGTICIKAGTHLQSDNTKSCGCIKNEQRRVYGKNHPCWNPYLTDKERLNRKIRGKGVRNIAFKRDNHTCKKCKHKGGKLIGHHLQGYHWFISGRFDPNNLVTLCKKCHRRFHSLFGNKYNTKAQFYEYLDI